MDEFKNDESWRILRHKVFGRFIVDLFSQLETLGIGAILLKGHAAGRYYPNPSDRVYSDIDIAVAPSEYQRVLRFRQSANLGFGLDVHSGLRHLHPSSFENLKSRTKTLVVEGSAVCVPADEDHLVILATHWLNDGGARRDRLDDIRYLIESCVDLDWELIWSILPRHRQVWLETAIACAVAFRGLDASRVPIPAERLSLPKWVTNVLSREWDGPPLAPLYYGSDSFSGLFDQFKKRFPPNPLVAVVENDADLGSRWIWFYQILSLLKRIPKAVEMQWLMRSHRSGGGDVD